MTIQLEFHRSARGPAPTDVDCWHLVFDENAKRLFVRHEWETARHSGTDEFEIAEFLAQEGAAQAALIDHLFRDHARTWPGNLPREALTAVTRYAVR